LYSIGKKLPIKVLENFNTFGNYSPQKPTVKEPPRYSFGGKYFVPSDSSSLGPG
jgi:hypothetical protein